MLFAIAFGKNKCQLPKVQYENTVAGGFSDIHKPYGNSKSFKNRNLTFF